MAVKTLHVLCQDCLNRETCNYIPGEGSLIRCLDRQTAEGKKRGDPVKLSAALSADAQSSVLVVK